ncbi:MAG: CTP synthase [Acholeplasmataceae bacterium]|nr:CTP synthase [Acholeplasmataceae bacterium]
MNTKFIFVTGGVASSLGKGINTSSIGRLLKCRGLKVFIQKFDPYINVDPGNMSPLQHGEVFVTDDGAETDLDLGHYERFIDENLNRHSSITTGKIYLRVIDNERRGKYDGATVQVIPHVTNEIKLALEEAAKTSGADVVIAEIGGTVGDIESLPYLEAIRQYRREHGYENTLYIHNTLVPYIQASQELKTKPTQHSVKELRSLGINPDIIILRTDRSLSQSQKEKIALFCDVNLESVIEARDCKVLYEVPIMLAKQKIDDIICRHFRLETKSLDLREWEDMVWKIKNLNRQVKIALVGKYVDLKDSYLSVYEALKHAGYANDVEVKIEAIKSGSLTVENVGSILQGYDGIIVPGGFGVRDIDGILNAIKYARENKIPYFGICFGMQLALIEYAINVLGHPEATSRELDENATLPVIDLKEIRKGMHNPMRLGLHPCTLVEGSKARQIYGVAAVKERHRHRYEVSNNYLSLFTDSDLIFSGVNEDEGIMEMLELKNHPWFIACQFHPEFLSRPNRPHPLFNSFIGEAAKRAKQ